MRLLVVGHTYMIRVNQEKWIQMAKLNRDIEIMLITPKCWPHKLFNINVEILKDVERITHIAMNTFFTGKETYYVYRGEISRVIKEFKPHIIHVEQGAHALVYFQVISKTRKLIPPPKKVFFTWWNLPYSLLPPKKWIERYNLKHTDLAICGNQEAAEILRKRGYKGRIEILPQLGVDPDIYYPRNESKLRKDLGLDNKIVIGYVGRLVKEKGLLTLLDALFMLSDIDWQLLIIGKGELKDLLINKIKKRNMEDRLIIIDSLPHHEIPLFLNCMDIFVLPSETSPFWKEQFGHVLIEAMACGVPVVGSNSGEIPRVIGDAGMVFEEKNSFDLKNKIKRLLMDEKLRQEMGRKGRNRVLKKFTHVEIARKLLSVYRELLSNN